MSDRVLKGSRLGSVSYESDRHTEFAPRSLTTYDCPLGHATAVPFAAEADIPFTWECRVCGAQAEQRDGEARHSHVKGMSASAAKGTAVACPSGQSYVVRERGANSVCRSLS